MKDRLTPPQSKRLIELGVDPSKASESRIVCKEPYLGAPNRFCNDVKVPIFTLYDILSLLPKTISVHGDICQLEIKWRGDEWIAKYDDSESIYFHSEYSPELINALFELLCWVLKNHPDQIKKLGR